jgi:hypothetical protein
MLTRPCFSIPVSKFFQSAGIIPESGKRASILFFSSLKISGLYFGTDWDSREEETNSQHLKKKT